MRSRCPAALHVRCVAYAVCHAACGACGAPTAPAPAPLRASSAVASRPLRARAAPSLHALHYASGVRAYGAHLYTPPRASKVTPRGPLRRAQGAACHVLCGDGARPKSSLRSKVALRQAQGFVVAAAQRRPTVAVLGESGVFDDVTAAARQRQAARGRA